MERENTQRNATDTTSIQPTNVFTVLSRVCNSLPRFIAASHPNLHTKLPDTKKLVLRLKKKNALTNESEHIVHRQPSHQVRRQLQIVVTAHQTQPLQQDERRDERRPHRSPFDQLQSGLHVSGETQTFNVLSKHIR